MANARAVLPGRRIFKRIRSYAALRPWRVLDISRLILAVTYAFSTLIFSSARSWAETVEHVVVLAMLALAIGALWLSARSWTTEMRIRKPVVWLDALLFLTLLIVTNPSDSPYFPGSLFVVFEIALIVRRRFHLMVGLFAALAAFGTLWVDQHMAIPAEPDGEQTVLRILFLIVVVMITGMLLGPRREVLLERERARRLAATRYPSLRNSPSDFLVEVLSIATGSPRVAIVYRMASHEPYRFASADHGVAAPKAMASLLAMETGWHDRPRFRSITLAADGVSLLHALTASGRAWAELLDADRFMSLRVSLGTFDAIGIAPLPDPTHEDAVAIAHHMLEAACEELMVRNSLDLAHVIAGARERERLQRDLHDSVLQALASIRFQVAPLLSGMPGAEPHTVIQNVDRIAKDQIATVRHIIDPELGENDFAYLPETLAMVVRSLGDQWGIDCELNVDEGNCATSAAIGRELSFAVREIVANAVRHARARSVEFQLQPAGNSIALHVTDDGVPNLARLGASSAVPSRSLTRRIQALGGEVYLRNLAGRTMIQITVPRK